MVSAENQHVFCEICAKIQRNFKKVVFEYKKDGKFVSGQISGGFITVSKEKTTILTESAKWNDEAK